MGYMKRKMIDQLERRKRSTTDHDVFDFPSPQLLPPDAPALPPPPPPPTEDE